MDEKSALQLAGEIVAFAGPALALVAPDAVQRIVASARAHVSSVVTRLADGDVTAARAILDALWPHGAPEQVGRAGWWRTPFGRACARVLAAHDRQLVTHAQAAAMLGVTRGTVGSLVARGRLTRAGGRVARASVLARLAGRPA